LTSKGSKQLAYSHKAVLLNSFFYASYCEGYTLLIWVSLFHSFTLSNQKKATKQATATKLTFKMTITLSG